MSASSVAGGSYPEALENIGTSFVDVNKKQQPGAKHVCGSYGKIGRKPLADWPAAFWMLPKARLPPK